MTIRTILSLLGLTVLVGVAVYLLFQIPAGFAIGGVVTLLAILAAIGWDAPDPL